MRVASCVASTARMVRATMDSSTGPRSSCSRWISSMMSSRTRLAYVRSPDLRVTMSHFSGVVTITCVSSISALDRLMSPVSSRTTMPYGCSRLVKLPTISATSAFMGATYTILNAPVSIDPSSRRCRPSVCMMVSMATLVLPAPVGAHTSMFSWLYSADSLTRDCTRFSSFMPANAGCAHSGSSLMATSFSPAAKGLGLSAGTCTSSYPFLLVRKEPSGRPVVLLALKWPPPLKARDSRSTTARAATVAATAPPPCPPSPPAAPPSRRRRASSLMLRSSADCLSRADVRVARSASRILAASGSPAISASMRPRASSSSARDSRVHHTTLVRLRSSCLMTSNWSKPSAMTRSVSTARASPGDPRMPSTCSASSCARFASIASPYARARRRCSQYASISCTRSPPSRASSPASRSPGPPPAAPAPPVRRSAVMDASTLSSSSSSSSSSSTTSSPSSSPSSSSSSSNCTPTPSSVSMA
mmetsp:Transcript_30308/g.77306  ORF Transcript_30308/g.77306 Transcript_30308/m.77306 type:complete len:475 (-) Transcript_30308:735-2159(-)